MSVCSVCSPIKTDKKDDSDKEFSVFLCQIIGIIRAFHSFLSSSDFSPHSLCLVISPPLSSFLLVFLSHPPPDPLPPKIKQETAEPNHWQSNFSPLTFIPAPHKEQVNKNILIGLNKPLSSSSGVRPGVREGRSFWESLRFLSDLQAVSRKDSGWRRWSFSGGRVQGKNLALRLLNTMIHQQWLSTRKKKHAVHLMFPSLLWRHKPPQPSLTGYV